MNKIQIVFQLNGNNVSVNVDPNKRLLDMLREDLNCKSVKEGCGEGECGACTVIRNGKAITSCSVLAGQVEGDSILTLEGISVNGEPDEIQKAFMEAGAIQCGFCTPGMVLSAKALLMKNPHPTHSDIRRALSGNLCRCTGYTKIIEAVELAANNIKKVESREKDRDTIIGHSFPRKDALQKATGTARFVADLSFDNMLYGEVLYSSIPHAKIKSIDVDKALKIPGIIKVLTFKDLPGENVLNSAMMDQQVLMSNKVYRIGDPIAIVAGETKELVYEAVKSINVEYEELEPVFTIDQALKKDAPIIHGNSNIMFRRFIERGNMEEGFANSDIIVENTYTSPRLSHMYLEPEGATAIYENGIITVYCCCQYAHFARGEVARVLKMPLSKVRVVLTTVGGGFGGKQDYALICHAALLAFYTRRPVKIVRTRKESTIASTKRHPFTIKAKTGATKDGKLMATQAVMFGDTGAYGDSGPSVATRAVLHFMGPYDVPNLKAECTLVYTNNPTSGSFRGFGVPQVAICHEGQMNALARELKIDPLEFRLLNAHKNGSVTATGQLLERVGFVETLLQAKQRAKNAMLGK